MAPIHDPTRSGVLIAEERATLEAMIRDLMAKGTSVTAADRQRLIAASKRLRELGFRRLRMAR